MTEVTVNFPDWFLWVVVGLLFAQSVLEGVSIKLRREQIRLQKQLLVAHRVANERVAV